MLRHTVRNFQEVLGAIIVSSCSWTFQTIKKACDDVKDQDSINDDDESVKSMFHD